MKKILKIVLFLILGLLALVLVAVLALPLWFGPVTQPVANAVMPKMTLSEFALGRASLNPYTGCLEIGGLRLGNPKGYVEKDAVSVGSLSVDVAMTSLASEFPRVEDVSVGDVFVSYETGGEYGVDNFTQLIYNMAGGKDEYERKQAKKKKSSGEAKIIVDHVGLKGFGMKCSVPGGTMTGMLTICNLAVDVTGTTVAGPSLHFKEIAIRDALIAYDIGGNNNKSVKTAPAKAAPAKDAAAPANAPAAQSAAAQDGAKKSEDAKLVIDRLVVSGIRLKLGGYGLSATVPVPTIELKDLGKKTQGMTFEEFCDQLWQAILKGASATGEGSKMLQSFLSKGASGALDYMDSGVKAIKIDKAADAVMGGANSTMKAISSGTGVATDAVGSGVKAVGDGAKKATDAAAGAVDSGVKALKGLFN